MHSIFLQYFGLQLKNLDTLRQCESMLSVKSRYRYLPCPIFSLVLVVDSDGLLFCLNNEVKQRPSWPFGRAENISILEDDTGTRCPTR